MMSVSVEKQIKQLETKLDQLHQQLGELKQKRDSQAVAEYTLKDLSGNDIKLSMLFGDKDDLILVHNMGKSCTYCTMWADGFIGMQPHLEDRAAFVVTTPDDPAVIKEFADSRDWTFRLYSVKEGPFKKDMGFESDDGSPQPGVSVFHKNTDGTIQRTGSDFFGPGDRYCAVWPFLDMLKDGPNGWEPKYQY